MGTAARGGAVQLHQQGASSVKNAPELEARVARHSTHVLPIPNKSIVGELLSILDQHLPISAPKALVLMLGPGQLQMRMEIEVELSARKKRLGSGPCNFHETFGFYRYASAGVRSASASIRYLTL